MADNQETKETDVMGFFETSRFGSDREEVIMYSKQTPDQRGAIAIELAARYGMVAAVPDGEDSAGRQQLRLQTPKELMERACAIANGLWEEFAQRGWLAKLPPPSLLEDKDDK